MTLKRAVVCTILASLWIYLTVFCVIDAYDRGYHDGVKNTTEIFLAFKK